MVFPGWRSCTTQGCVEDDFGRLTFNDLLPAAYVVPSCVKVAPRSLRTPQGEYQGVLPVFSNEGFWITLVVTVAVVAVGDGVAVATAVVAVGDGVAVATAVVAVGDDVAVATAVVAVGDGVAVVTAVVAVGDGVAVGTAVVAVGDGVAVATAVVAVGDGVVVAVAVAGARSPALDSGWTLLSSGKLPNTFVA